MAGEDDSGRTWRRWLQLDQRVRAVHGIQLPRWQAVGDGGQFFGSRLVADASGAPILRDPGPGTRLGGPGTASCGQSSYGCCASSRDLTQAAKASIASTTVSKRREWNRSNACCAPGNSA
jgi:hypothetical protein